MLSRNAMPGDLDLIDELLQRDMRASKDRDYRTLRSLMSDDAVVLPTGCRAIRGRDALDKSFAAMSDALATIDVLDYRFDWKCEYVETSPLSGEASSVVSATADRELRPRKRIT